MKPSIQTILATIHSSRQKDHESANITQAEADEIARAFEVVHQALCTAWESLRSCQAVHPHEDTLILAEAILADDAPGFLREATRTTANQLRAALESGETEKAGELAAWLRREDWV